jgi:Mce-associated membrane protein
MVLALMLAAGAYAGHAWWQAREVEAAHSEAIAAARQLATNFVSISAASVDADLARIAAGATGEFGEEFGRGMPGVRQAVLENKVESAGTVLRAGLVSGDADSAVVLVAIDATVKNVKAPDGRISHYRIQLDLALDTASGKWLVAKLQFVG